MDSSADLIIACRSSAGYHIAHEFHDQRFDDADGSHFAFAGNMLFGGEGLFLASLTGPGKVYLQSMPIMNLAEALSPYLPRGESAATDNTASGIVGGIVGGLLRGR
jgi:hypothetical protein